MALFGGIRDAKFVASINYELVNAIVDTEIEFFKMIVDKIESNIYGESDSKYYYDSILIPCLVAKDVEKAHQMDDYGHSYTRSAKFNITRDILERAGFYPETGDIILWDNEYYEIDGVTKSQYFVGKNPDTWPNGDQHGYSVSVICDAHVTRQTTFNIKNLRRGGDNNFSYTGTK